MYRDSFVDFQVGANFPSAPERPSLRERVVRAAVELALCPLEHRGSRIAWLRWLRRRDRPGRNKVDKQFHCQRGEDIEREWKREEVLASVIDAWMSQS